MLDEVWQIVVAQKKLQIAVAQKNVTYCGGAKNTAKTATPQYVTLFYIVALYGHVGWSVTNCGGTKKSDKLWWHKKWQIVVAQNNFSLHLVMSRKKRSKNGTTALPDFMRQWTGVSVFVIMSLLSLLSVLLSLLLFLLSLLTLLSL